MIFALSPQAKGRVERAAGTFQDWLVTELQLAGASGIGEANSVLEQFLPRFNQRFRATLPGNASGQRFRATLPGNASGQRFRATLPGNASGQRFRATLPGNAATPWACIPVSQPGAVLGTGPMLQAPQESGQGQHGEVPVAHPPVAARAGTPQLCRGGCGGSWKDWTAGCRCGMKAHPRCPGGAAQPGIPPKRSRAFRTCSCPDLRRPPLGRTLDGGSRTTGLKGRGREGSRGHYWPRCRRRQDQSHLSAQADVPSADVPSEGEMEGDSESQAQGDVA